MSQFANAVIGPDGPIPPTKVELEILDNGSVRWTLWRDDRRLYSHVAKQAEIPVMLESTALMLQFGINAVTQ
jgi:hypothetical protein